MSFNCPKCGSPVEFEQKYAKVISCKYCNSILEFGGSELTKIGEQGDFIDFPSIFVVGKDIEFRGKKVHIKGQLRYEYDGGFFDKYYVSIDGEDFYIKEDDGIITITKQGNWEASEISLLDKEVGKQANILGKDLFIQESGTFKLVNIKGFVNSLLAIGRDYEYLDGISGGKMIFIEKDISGNMIIVSEEISL